MRMRDETNGSLQVFSDLWERTSLITTADHDGWHGFITTEIYPVSERPPTMMICSDNKLPATSAFLRGRRLCVSIVDGACTEAQALLRRRDGMEICFDAAGWVQLPSGLPAWDGALAFFDCTIAQVVHAGGLAVVFATISTAKISISGDQLACDGKADGAAARQAGNTPRVKRSCR